MLKVGIVGLPNVGKSTLFNALLKKSIALEANYPFATIDPNIGVIEVPDDRLGKLASIVSAKKIVPAAVEFYDIAGLVAGASTGEGLGNQFLSHIREVAAVAHVVRLFEDGDIIHVSNKVNPIDDIKTIETELILADLSTVAKQREPRGNAPKEEVAAYKTFQKLREALDQGTPARQVSFNEDERAHLKQLNLITAKPVIYCFNSSLEQLDDLDGTHKTVKKLLADAGSEDASYLLFNPLEETTLNSLIQKAYETLGLISFLTAGEIEARAWTIPTGTLAPGAAGVIHTDFEKKFIKAEVVKYDDFVTLGGWSKARESGKAQMCGRDYLMQNGDVVDFKIGA